MSKLIATPWTKCGTLEKMLWEIYKDTKCYAQSRFNPVRKFVGKGQAQIKELERSEG